MTARILVTGSRHWTDARLIVSVLARWSVTYPGAVLVHGGCRGADRIAAGIWLYWGLPVEGHPANWDTYGRAAGPLRNKHMVSLGATLCLAFLHTNSQGSAHCAAMAENAGIPVLRFYSEEATS